MDPSRGEVWLVDLNPTRGHEQSGTRAALVVSVDKFNHGPAGLVVIVPVTTRDKGIRSHVRVEASKGGLAENSFIKSEEVRCVSKDRFIKLYGTVDAKVMAEVGYGIATILGI